MKWITENHDPSLIAEFTNNLNISPILANILLSRKIKTVKEAYAFLNPKFPDHLFNPFLLPDMVAAVSRIRTALEKNEKILIYGDRDVDGLTSTAILYYTLKSLGLIPLCYIPSREINIDSSEPANNTYRAYGLHTEIIDDYIKKENISLLISVDCGITAVNEIKYSKQRGIDTIVIDHHEPQTIDNKQILPSDAVALVNPKISTGKYPLQDIAGCNVVYKLSQALMMSYDKYYNEPMIVFDIETTGLESDKSEIIEIAALKIRNFIVEDTFHSLIKPKTPISEYITGINGITNEMCKDAPGIDTVLKQFTGFISNAPLIAHNAPFDTKFIKHILKLLNLPDINNDIIDTLKLSRELFPDQSHKLNILSKNLGLGHDNPHRAVDDTYATLNLYEKICQVKNTRINFFLQDHLDLVTLGTISDMMPLISENRVIVKHGLQQLQHTRKKGIAYLMEYLGRRTNVDTITLKHISFNLIPVLNSCGRLDQANFALDLLITEDSKKTADLLERVFFLNEERKNIQVILIDQIKKLIGEQCDINNDKLLFIADPDNSLQTPEGLIGMITTRFAYLYNKPVIIISGSTGAARSVNEFNILQLLTQCKDLLTRFGGHNQAAGFSIQPAKIREFRTKINTLLQSQDYADSVELVLKIDAELTIPDINKNTTEELDKLEPFGHGNPSPAFILKNVKLQKHEKSGNKLYLNIIKDNNMIIGSCQDFDIDNLKLSAYFDIAFQINTSKTAKKNNELVILDIKPSAI